ncbi:MAG: hypothetical protein WCC84_17175 [Candidatus Cybelea sp.]
MTAQKLLDVFRQHSTQAIKTNGRDIICRAFRIPPEAYVEQTRDSNFATAYANLLGIRKRVDDVLSRRPSRDARQVSLALALLKLYRRSYLFAELQACTEILRAAAYPRWQQNDRVAFDKGCVVFPLEDYFLSYTNREADDTNYYFRQAFIGQMRRGASEGRFNYNLVALAIEHRLSRNNLQGFFDVNEIRLGDSVREKITHGAEHSIVFIQLLEMALLTRPRPGETNWCFHEFERYGGSHVRDQLAFLLAAQLAAGADPVGNIRPADVPEAYDDWVTAMNRCKLQELKTNPSLLRDQLNEVAREVKRMRDDVFYDITAEDYAYTKEIGSRP